MLLGQIEVIRRNETLIKHNAPVWLREVFKNKWIPWCGKVFRGHGKAWQEKHYTVTLRRDASDPLERKIYAKCVG